MRQELRVVGAGVGVDNVDVEDGNATRRGVLTRRWQYRFHGKHAFSLLLASREKFRKRTRVAQQKGPKDFEGVDSTKRRCHRHGRIGASEPSRHRLWDARRNTIPIFGARARSFAGRAAESSMGARKADFIVTPPHRTKRVTSRRDGISKTKRGVRIITARAAV